jgi:uncharacterized protein (DUF2235 family)
MVRKKVNIGKKVKAVKYESKLDSVVNEDRPEKEPILLKVDADLLNRSREAFGRRLSKIFEAALEDALKMKKDKGA